LVITLGGGRTVTGDRLPPLEDLASQLSDAETEIRIDSNPLPGLGVVFGEIVVIYIAMKAVDTLTEDALNALFARIVNVAKGWARKRVQDRIDAGMARVMATYVEPRDENGRQVGPSVAARANPDGEVEVTIEPVSEQGVTRPIFFDPSWLEGRDGSGDDEVSDEGAEQHG
jgi:hypothetical protein